MKRILILTLLFLVLLEGVVYANEISGTFQLSDSEVFRFEDAMQYQFRKFTVLAETGSEAVDKELERFLNTNWDVGIETCLFWGKYSNVGRQSLVKMQYMGNQDLDSYEDCSTVNSYEGGLSPESYKEGAVHCIRTYDGGHYAKIKTKKVFTGQVYEGVENLCSFVFDYVYQDDGTPYFGNKALQPSKPVHIEASASVKAPNVITKRVTPGTINVQDGEIVFEISNEDPNHKLKGYLACDIPNDVIVTSSIGAATGEEAQYISPTFTVDPAPARESMSLRLSTQNEGSKYVRCSINYALFKEGKGYVTTDGEYGPDIKYQQVTVNRDIVFKKEPKEEVREDFLSKNIYYVLGGIGLLIILFLIYKLGHLSGQVKKK
jgi:hypothetical protein